MLARTLLFLVAVLLAFAGPAGAVPVAWSPQAPETGLDRDAFWRDSDARQPRPSAAHAPGLRPAGRTIETRPRLTGRARERNSAAAPHSIARQAELAVRARIAGSGPEGLPGQAGAVSFRATAAPRPIGVEARRERTRWTGTARSARLQDATPDLARGVSAQPSTARIDTPVAAGTAARRALAREAELARLANADDGRTYKPPPPPIRHLVLLLFSVALAAAYLGLRGGPQPDGQA